MKLSALLIFLLINTISCYSSSPKILHLSFHKGCINDFAEVARELSLDVINWYILADQTSRHTFDPEAIGNDIYNITAERATRIWELNKDYFNEFDIIITSDTAPLCRIFLQNNWNKPLIIWICNRFDYYDGETASDKFPDPTYYDLFREAINKPNVKIISYTPYEQHYAHQKEVDIGYLTIRPIGTRPQEHETLENPNEKNTLFIYPRLTADQLDYTQAMCDELSIKTYSGAYSSPDDLIKFKAILYFPYQWSNLALFENIQQGIVHFVPSKQFVIDAAVNEKPIRYCTLEDFHLCEWYCDEYKDLFIYFDSWLDLKEKLETTDYATMHVLIKERGLLHWSKNLNAWKNTFENL